MNAEPKITISKKEYEDLQDDSEKYHSLEAFGVDNWEGYADAMEALEED